MCFKINIVVCPLALSLFTLSSVTYTAQAASDVKKSSDQCVKGGKAVPAAKTKDICIKEGGSWVENGAANMPVDPLEKNKAVKMPDDPLDKNKATKMPPDPFGKNKAIKLLDGKNKAVKMPVDPLDKNKATKMPPDPFDKSKNLK